MRVKKATRYRRLSARDWIRKGDQCWCVCEEMWVPAQAIGYQVGSILLVGYQYRRPIKTAPRQSARR
jgi:hypothetical protein